MHNNAWEWLTISWMLRFSIIGIHLRHIPSILIWIALMKCGSVDARLWSLLQFYETSNKNEPWHGISNNVVCAASKASDQPAHTCSLIRAFASRLNIFWVFSYWLNIIWSFYAQTKAAQVRLSLHLFKCHIVGNHMSRLNLQTTPLHPVNSFLQKFFFPCLRPEAVKIIQELSCYTFYTSTKRFEAWL